MKSTLKKNWERIVLCLCMANFACVGIAQTNKKLPSYKYDENRHSVYDGQSEL
mgnify:CR=1 FL=1